MKRLVVLALVALAWPATAQSGSDPAASPPEFKPGIPGLTMTDVREHKHLWREIEELQSWERSDRITIAEFRAKTIEKTSQFLGFEGEVASRFTALATSSVAGLRSSFLAGRQTNVDPSQLDSAFAGELSTAVERVSAALRPEPRHQLFAAEVKKWLLRLAFSPSEAKEAKENAAAAAMVSGP